MTDPFLINPQHTAVLQGDRSALDAKADPLQLFIGIGGTFLFGLLVLGMLGVLGNYLITEARFAANGTLTQGRVLEREAFIDPEDPDDIKDARWWMVYEYEANGRTYQHEQDILPDVFVATEGAETVPVRYVAGAPGLSRLAVDGAEAFNTGGVVALSIGMLIFGGVGLIFWRQWQNARHEVAALVTAGQPIEGVLRRARGFGASAETYRVAVTAAFQQPQTGERVVITAEASRPDLFDAPLPEKGTPVIVWYASEDVYQLL